MPICGSWRHKNKAAGWGTDCFGEPSWLAGIRGPAWHKWVRAVENMDSGRCVNTFLALRPRRLLVRCASNPMIIIKKTLFALVATLTFPLFAANPGGVIDPAKAGPDFKIQGEYVGTHPEGDPIGLNIIALGDGKFRAVGFEGGLPGDGWTRENKKDLFTVTKKDGKMTAPNTLPSSRRESLFPSLMGSYFPLSRRLFVKAQQSDQSRPKAQLFYLMAPAQVISSRVKCPRIIC